MESGARIQLESTINEKQLRQLANSPVFVQLQSM
jgi:hypothetical protein